MDSGIVNQDAQSSPKVEASTRCSMVESQCVMDYTSEFTTFEVFKSRQALCNWAREVGKRNGLVIVITKSDVTSKGRIARLTLGCERGGHYKNRSNDIETHSEKRQKRRSGTKKCGCPFALKGLKMPTEDEWMLTVLCGVHNHPAAEHLEGHSYAGRLTGEENELVVDMSKSMARPKDILATLKQKDVLNASTMRTIYNARKRYKVNEKVGRSQMQYLLRKLEEHKYIEWHRSSDTTETLNDLFWAHPRSVELLCAFPHVLIMDCTYKTNMYHLPLLEIVGVTSTDMTFSIAFVYLQSEHEDNYMWALGRLRNIMEDHDVMPNLIVTDRELGLMNAIGKVFPNVRHILCRWHISRNVLAKCEKMFESMGQWDKFMSLWNLLVLSATEAECHEHLAALQREFSSYPDALQYVSTTWLTPYRERFVSAWIDTFMHYGNVTTNRAASAHAKLKRQIGCSTLNFETSWPHIHSLIELQHTDIKASFQKSLTVDQHNFKGMELREIQGKISISALENILGQMRRANIVGVDALACGCVNRRTHGLPCAHEIVEYKREGRPIPLDCIDPHWRKLDMVPAPNKQTMELNFQAEMDLFVKRFEGSDAESKVQMLKKLREIACPETTHVMEPTVVIARTRGLPRINIDSSTCHYPSAFELALSGQDSHSPG